jgi:hypothetical protein
MLCSAEKIVVNYQSSERRRTTMNKRASKITLHRETLRRLTVADLREAAGGVTLIPCTNTCGQTCHGGTCDKTVCASVCCP